jgi:glutamyl-tRNA reductase
LREHFDDIRQAELTRNASLLATMTVEQRESVEEMTMALVNKLLHIPTVRLKQLMASNPEQHPEELLRDLFNLETAKIVELGAN